MPPKPVAKKPAAPIAPKPKAAKPSVAKPAPASTSKKAESVSKSSVASKKSTTATNPPKAGNETASSVAPSVDPHILDAVIKLQKVFRMILAQRVRQNKQKEKQTYEDEMNRLEKEAFLFMVKMQQAEAERKRQQEEEERRRIAEHNRRKVRMLEAAFDGSVSDCEKILKEIADLDTKNGLKNDVIGTALRNRHQLEMVNCRDANQNTPLMEAASGGSTETVNFLLQRGGEINARGQFMRTALYRAAFAGHVDVVQILLSNGADPRLYDEQAQAPVDVAHNETVKDLLQQWNLEETEKMLVRIEHFRKQRMQEESKRHEAEMSAIETRVKQAEKQLEASKSRLNKAYEEREKRIHEHDVAVLEGFQRTDVTENMIHDAEFEVENAKLDFKKATEKLSLLKLELRDKRKEGKSSEFSQDKGTDDDDDQPGIHCGVRDLDDVLLRDVGNRIKESGKWPVVVDNSGQSATFLRYRDTNFINALSPENKDQNRVRLALLGALRYGKPFVLDMMEVDLYQACGERFDTIMPGLMRRLVDKTIVKPEIYLKLLRPGDSPEYDKNNFMEHKVNQFTFILLTQNPFPSEKILHDFMPVWVEVNQG